MERGAHSVFRRKGGLPPEQQARGHELFHDVVQRDLAPHFSRADRLPEFPESETTAEFPEARQLETAIASITDLMLSHAANGKSLSTAERQQSIDTLTTAIDNCYLAATRRDQRRLEVYADGEDEQPLDLTSIEEDLVLLLKERDAAANDKEIEEIDDAIALLNEQKRILLTVQGQQGNRRSTEAERLTHIQSVKEFRETEATSPERFRASEVAKQIVDEYALLLTVYKVRLGMESNYSPEEIIAELLSELPDADPKRVQDEVTKLINDHNAERQERPITEAEAFMRVLGAIYGEDKLVTAGFVAAAVGGGFLAPKMGQHLGTFLETGERNEALTSAGYGIASMLWQVEMRLRLSEVLTTKLYPHGGLAERITDTILASSPELFAPKKQALVRQHIEGTINNLEHIAKASLEIVGGRLARMTGLATALAVELRDPSLFAPVVGAAMYNLVTARALGNRVATEDRATREAQAALVSRIDEAMEVRRSRGKPTSIGASRLKAVEEAKRSFERARATLQAATGITTPMIMAANALLMDFAGPQAVGDYAKASMYSTQLAAELQMFVDEASRVRHAITPILDLMRIAQEFKETHEGEVPLRWDMHLTDVQRKILRVPELSLPQGELCVVVGERGSGKSTLLEVLFALPAQRGLVEIDGKFSSRIDKEKYRDGVFISNQFYVVKTGTLRENIVDDLPYDESAFQECLREHRFDTFAKKIAAEQQLTDPINDMVLNTHAELSGGERKGLSLAAIDYRLRVAPDSLKMILLDEPTSGIDRLNSARVFATIARWRREHPDKTIVIVNHDPDLFAALPGDPRILGVANDGLLSQDEPLSKARENTNQPFARIFS